MRQDTFICGTCQEAFSEIETFMKHKKDGCTESAETADVIQVHFAGDITTTTNDGSIPLVVGEAGTNTSVTYYNQSDLENSGLVTLDNSNEQTVVILKEDTEVTNKSTCTTDTQTEPVLLPKKKGRPKAKKKVEVEKKEIGRPSAPETGADGRLSCPRCKRSFTKERYFNTHKCLDNDYIDLTKKEVFAAEIGGEDEERDDGEIEDDRMDEYTAPIVIADDDDDVLEAVEEVNQLEKRQRPYKKRKVFNSEGPGEIQIINDIDVDSSSSKKTTDSIADIPVFTSDAERLEFEVRLNVDLSNMDYLFSCHCIMQDVPEKPVANNKKLSNELYLYTCNVCLKVFKTLSHIRLHCLIHTDLKPFKCTQCNYASNSKGNLYTHMRRHTGQFYRCDKCTFVSANKTHLLEHEATHSSTRHLCKLCKKDYNTQKSLMNHVRKYHSSDAQGKEYLEQFLNRRSKSQTIIHQCHVCNRKFKKKVDRDRHLLTHDITDIPQIQKCEICDYTTSRRVYLEKHYLKHRVVYSCFMCSSRYLSSVRLIDHLNTVHLQQDPSTTWETLFEQCINNSIYLPEPDTDKTSYGSEILNLPPELSQSSIQLSNASQEKEESEKLLEDVNKTGNVPQNEDNSLITAVQPPHHEQQQSELVSMETDAEGNNQEKNDNNSKDHDLNETRNHNVPPSACQTDQNMVGEGVEEQFVSNLDTEEMADAENKLDEIPNVESHEAQVILQDDSQSEELPDKADMTITPLDNMIAKIGYRTMNMDIFHKMRETFGSEECEYCGRLFHNKSDFEAHLRIHTGEKPHKCDYCDFKAVNNNILKRHMDKEHKKVAYECNECEFQTFKRNSLWSHRIKHLAAIGLQCPNCPEKTDSMKKLRLHILEKHPEMEMEELEKLTGYKHRLHGKMGRRSYKCPYCDRIFTRANSELQKHIWMHEGIKPFKCSICSYSCRSKNNLQAHMLRHSNEKPYACEECGKAYKSRTALRWHVRSHKNGKMFKCTKCPYEAVQSSHLKRHMETHDVIKRFMCQLCDFSANTLQFMKIHHARCHKGAELEFVMAADNEQAQQNSETKVFKCLSCDYLFGNMSELKRHLRVRHQVQVQDMANLEFMEMSDVQVVQYVDDNQGQSDLTDQTQTIVTEVPQQTIGNIEGREMDAKTVSAVTLLQQIMNMNQGNIGEQQVTLMNENGEMMTVDSDAIIVHEENEEVLLTDGTASVDGNQYVIQYVTQQPDGTQVTEMEAMPTEVITSTEEQMT